MISSHFLKFVWLSAYTLHFNIIVRFIGYQLLYNIITKEEHMFELLDIVRVKKEYPELSLTPKYIGTIVDVHNGGEAYTVEFIDENGDTIEKALYTEFAESELEKVTIIHGLDLPNEVAERNSLIMMKQLGITKEDIENYEIDDTDYICNDDNVLEELIAIRNMTDEEFETANLYYQEREYSLWNSIKNYKNYESKKGLHKKSLQKLYTYHERRFQSGNQAEDIRV